MAVQKITAFFALVVSMVWYWWMNKPIVIITGLCAVRGELVSVADTDVGVHVFLGLPFAKPPVGPLRLAPPERFDLWTGVRDATKHPPRCIQSATAPGNDNSQTTEISEDCLYLNIYTPAIRSAFAKLPVMVWIHGGALIGGSASAYDGSVLAAHENVVVVVIQYRLGPLGFISTGDENLPGNYGFLDQIQALRWVKDHIHKFGGDPDLVTAFGQSAGGVSVSYLLLSPLTEGLIHRAISQSGGAKMDIFNYGEDPLPVAKLLNPLTEGLYHHAFSQRGGAKADIFNYGEDPLTVAKELGAACGCPLENTAQLSLCIKYCDIEIFLQFSQTIKFPITVDGHFLEKPVDELYKDYAVLPVPYLLGVVKHEGGWVLSEFINPPNWATGMTRDLIDRVLSIFYSDPLPRQLLMDEYGINDTDVLRNRDEFMEMLGDMFFVAPAIQAANAQKGGGAPVYLYEFSHQPSFQNLPDFIKGLHGDELYAVWGLYLTMNRTLVDSREVTLSRKVMNYWANFARSGNPVCPDCNCPNVEDLAPWPEYGAEEKYLQIRLTEQVPAEHMRAEQVVFLTETLPQKIQEEEEEEEKEAK